MAKRSGRAGSVALVLLSLLLGVLIVCAGIFAGISTRYKDMFLPGTTINGIDVSGMTVAQVQQAMIDLQGEYSLTLLERDGKVETISGSSIHLALAFDDTLDRLLQAQNPNAWPLALWGNRTSTQVMETSFSYDTSLLTQEISRLQCMNSAASTPPKDAYIAPYDPTINGVEIKQEVEGNLVKQDILLPAILDAISTMRPELDLEALDCYEKPAVRSDDPALVSKANQLNEYLGIDILYYFGDNTVELNGIQLQGWLTFHEDGSVDVDEAAVTAFVRNLAYNYNTCFATREFKTSYGETVTIKGGDYGWWMDEPAEVEALTQAILNKESGVREPVWKATAAVLGVGSAGDYGNTYVEVNLTAQHLFFYKNGQLVLESDFVSGKNDGTPTGTYGLTYCERYATLNGENYSSPVSYWMPFSGNVGLHDASWRTVFGGNLYQSGGSHGCVNLPIKVARSIYENVTTNTPVIVYKLDGTARTSTSSQSYEEIASAVVSALNEISAEGSITSGNYSRMKKRIEWVQAAYNHLPGGAQAQVTNYSLLSQAVSDLNAYKRKNGL